MTRGKISCIDHSAVIFACQGFESEVEANQSWQASAEQVEQITAQEIHMNIQAANMRVFSSNDRDQLLDLGKSENTIVDSNR